MPEDSQLKAASEPVRFSTDGMTLLPLFRTLVTLQGQQPSSASLLHVKLCVSCVRRPNSFSEAGVSNQREGLKHRSLFALLGAPPPPTSGLRAGVTSCFVVPSPFKPHDSPLKLLPPVFWAQEAEVCRD